MTQIGPRRPARRIAFAAAALLLTGAGQPGTGVPVPGEVAAMPPLTPADIDEALQIGGSEIDARKLRSRMTVDVEVNDRGPFRFVVDSGADTSVVGQRLASQLALPGARPVTLNGMTETREVPQVLVESMKVGPTEVYALEMPVLREFDIGGDGMLGLDALIEQRLMLDFDKRVITVDDGRTPEPSMDGEVIVVKGRMQRGQLILTQVKTGPISLEAVIDTGSEISIGNRALRDKIINRRTAKIKKVMVYGVTGAPAELELAIVPSLKLGPITLENVPIAFADVPPFKVFGLSEKPSLLLGTDVMETFKKVSLDFYNRKVRFQLRKCTAEGVMLRTSAVASRLSADKDSACEK